MGLREISDTSGFYQMHDMTGLIWVLFCSHFMQHETELSFPSLAALSCNPSRQQVLLVGGDDTGDELRLDHYVFSVDD